MMRLTANQRKIALTAIVAGAAAVIADHMLRPSLKKKLKVR